MDDGVVAKKAITQQEWQEIQQIELATWTPTGYNGMKPYPSFEGKMERERAYQRKMLDELRVSGFAGIVVDVGCGASPILEQVAGGNFIGIGVDPLISGYAKYYNVFAWKNTMPLCCPAEEIMLPDASVHYVISTNALDHVRDPHAAFSEIVRILRPGGTLMLVFCVNNATEGHPHPAHKIDLSASDIGAWAREFGLNLLREKDIEYGWRKQAAYLSVWGKGARQ